MGLPQSELHQSELLQFAAIQQKQCRLYEVEQSLEDSHLHAVIRKLETAGFHVIYSKKESRRTLGIVGNPEASPDTSLDEIRPFLTTLQVIKPYKLASHEFHLTRTVVQIGEEVIGDRNIPLVSACDDLSSLRTVLSAKNNSSPGAIFIDLSFDLYEQGVKNSALEILKSQRINSDKQFIIRVDSSETMNQVIDSADALYIHGNQMQNYNLLQDAAQSLLPVFLERGIRSTMDEWLAAAEYILANGNPNLILSTRGIRTFANDQDELTMDVASIPMLKSLTHLPVVVDVRSAAQSAGQLQSISAAAVASGADGLFFPSGEIPVTGGKEQEKLKLIASSLGRKM
ncbi:MAG: hypothetical protein GF372_12815 [Candidatus Marinimicrobia bacterium]|nr:hypothetical protein [Candidatus Neomarinimicrobiota bacterium]